MRATFTRTVCALLLAILALGGAIPLADAGDSPDIPYNDLVAGMPALLAQRTELATLHDRLCPASPAPDAAAFAEAATHDALDALITALRLSTKELEDKPGWLVHYEDQLDDYVEDPEERARYRTAMDHARRLDTQLAGLGKLVKKARSAVKKVSPDAPETAAEACEALGALRTRLEAIEPGIFAP